MQTVRQAAQRRPKASAAGKTRATRPAAPVAATAPAPAALGHLDHVLGYVLRRAQIAVFNDFRRAFAEHDISPTQYAVLSIIADQPGLRQGDVSAALGIKRTNFVAVLDELERRGLARRQAVADDRRSRALFLTDDGAALAERLRKLNAAHELRLASALPAGQAETLIELLKKLTDGVGAADDGE